MDTRLIGRPKSFSGQPEEWQSWSIVMRAYAGAISARLLEMMQLVEAQRPEEMVESAMESVEDKQMDNQLYFILAMLLEGRAQDKVGLVGAGQGLLLWKKLTHEYESKALARQAGLLQSILNFRFVEGDMMNSLERFERQVKHYNSATGRTLGDDVMAGIVIRQMGTEGALAQHLILHAGRLDTYEKIRNEIVDIKMAQQHLATPMEIGALMGKSGKGRGQAKGLRNPEEKGKSGKGVERHHGGKGDKQQQVVCYLCGKPGHKASECWSGTTKGKGKGTKNGGTNSSSKGQRFFEGNCGFCGKYGHMKRDCRKLQASKGGKPAHSLEAGGSAQGREQSNAVNEPAAEPTFLSCLDLCALEVGKESSKSVRIGVDSCAGVSVWPENLHPKKMIQTPESKSGLCYQGAGSQHEVRDLGARTYFLETPAGIHGINVRVANVRKPLLSVGDLNDHGFSVHFIAGGPAYMEKTTTKQRINLQRRNNVFELNATVHMEQPGFQRQGVDL